MLGRLQDLVIRISKTWWLYLIVLFLFIGSLQALMRIGERFPAHAAGATPFDLQNDLEAAEVYPQIAGYTEQARELYYAFTLIDYAFPFFAGLFISATVAFALRYSMPRFYEGLAARKLLLIPMLATAFDWLENVVAVSIIALYPAEAGWLPGLLVAAKKLKLGFMWVGNGAMVVAVLGAAGTWLGRRVGR
jgi:TPR repeat protein